MILPAILFVTTVISLGHSDEVTVKDLIKTVSSTEMMLEIFTDNAWESTYVGDLLMDEKMTVIDSIEAPTELPSQIITDDDWDTDYSENTVAPTEIPSEIITDDDWDPTFNVGELLMDEKRMLQLINGNQTTTQEIIVETTVCSTDCENTAANAQSDSDVNTGVFNTVRETTTTTLRSVDFTQSPCTATLACSNDPTRRFLEEDEGPGIPTLSATLTITILLNDEIPTTDLVETITTSDSFEVVTETLEVATKGTVSDPEVVLIEITQPPTQAPTALPTEEPTPAPTNKRTERPQTKKPTERPQTKKPTERPQTKKPTERPQTKNPKPTKKPTERPQTKKPIPNSKSTKKGKSTKLPTKLPTKRPKKSNKKSGKNS